MRTKEFVKPKIENININIQTTSREILKVIKRTE